MRRWSDRAQVEPFAAVVAVIVVCLTLSLYGVVLSTALPDARERSVADATLEAIEEAVAPIGVARPSRLDGSLEAGPQGYRTNVTLEASERRWTSGPTPPSGADRARTSIGVRVGPGAIRTGALGVTVW